MKGMKLYIMRTADMHCNAAWNIGVDPFLSIHKREMTEYPLLIASPGYTVLIDHPTAGWIMYDTGVCDEPEKVWAQNQLDGCIMDKKDWMRMKTQLDVIGLKPEDIDHVILSHFHCDHVGNNNLFAETADFYVDVEEANYAFRMVMHTNDRNACGWFNREEVLLPVKEMHYLDKDQELFPDIKVVQLPGHTPGTLGLLVHLENTGTLLFPNDSCPNHLNYDEWRVPAGPYDSLTYKTWRRKVFRQSRFEKGRNHWNLKLTHLPHSLPASPAGYAFTL